MDSAILFVMYVMKVHLLMYVVHTYVHMYVQGVFLLKIACSLEVHG